METRRIFGTTIASLLACAASQGELVMDLGANRVHYQISGQSLRFDGGELSLHLRDGNYLLDGACLIDPQPVYFPPSDLPSCPLGATGLVASGDVNGDGVRDDNLYWSMLSVVPAAVVEPSRQELCQLYAGPPSKLPRPLSNFKDETAVIFYDISATIQQLSITEYDLNRPYGPGAGELKRMKEELIPGQYVFTFPRLSYPELTPVALAVTIVSNLEAVDPASRTRGGFRFTSGTWDDEFYQMDSRLINAVKWTGNDRSVVRPGDAIYFSILDSSETDITFPPTVPEAPVFLTTPTVQAYNLPPFFYSVGDEGVLRLEYERLLRTNGVAYDSSLRDFRAKIRFVDSYAGYVQTTLPLGSSKRDLAATGDIDHDGMSNAEEFAYQYPTNEDVSASAKEQYVPIGGEHYRRLVTEFPNPITDAATQPPGPVGPYLDAENHIVFEVPFRKRVGNTLKYTFQEATTKNGKTKYKNLKLGSDWEVTKVSTEDPTPVNVIIETELDGDRTQGPATVTLTKDTLVLRSTAPVADPVAPLPDLAVKITPVTLK